MQHVYEPTITGARRAAALDDRARWVAEFLDGSGGDGQESSAGRDVDAECWAGPLLVALDDLHDPSDGSVSSSAAASPGTGFLAEPAPLIAAYTDQGLAVADGAGRVEALQRHGADRAWAVIGFDSVAERTAFLDRHPNGFELVTGRNAA